jgi:predicted DNA-binding transcriptional regulator AlpA
MTTVVPFPHTRLKKADVCAELGISPRTLDNLVQRNEFPPGVRIGKWCYWSSKVLDSYRERAFNLQEQWTPLTRRRR